MKNTRMVILALVVIGAFGYLLFMGMQEGSMYYLEVSEYLKKIDELGDRKVRVNGRVVKESLDFDSKNLVLRFLLMDIKSDDKLSVLYHGSPPDLLGQDGVTAVAEGHFDKSQRVFLANQLLVKCPSKYERKEKGI
ncbi:MAG: cytochrome c maturation protein CcmE [Nitrospirae bacterium]|nr:cytochrome c maturation protein CcmE [Nitrospirota bacterium]